MNEKKLKKLYREHTVNTSPDMNALWERIESGLEEKPGTGVTSKPVKCRVNFAKLAAAGAMAAAVIIMLPVAFGNTAKNMDMSENAGAMNAAAPATTAYVTYGQEDFAADGDIGENFTGGRVYYEELDLAPSPEPDAVPLGETSGDDFFVEDNVLIQTDVIVNAYIDRVYGRGKTVCYDIIARSTETGETGNITIESETPYLMRENREYILPLKRDGDSYSLVFENAPQIELTRDGGMIFHNGWSCLDGEDSLEVVCPQGKADDFFYDRMKFSYKADVGKLLEKWQEIQNVGS